MTAGPEVRRRARRGNVRDGVDNYIRTRTLPARDLIGFPSRDGKPRADAV
jgi:hypothetical protein